MKFMRSIVCYFKEKKILKPFSYEKKTHIFPGIKFSQVEDNNFCVFRVSFICNVKSKV